MPFLLLAPASVEAVARFYCSLKPSDGAVFGIYDAPGGTAIIDDAHDLQYLQLKPSSPVETFFATASQGTDWTRVSDFNGTEIGWMLAKAWSCSMSGGF